MNGHWFLIQMHRWPMFVYSLHIVHSQQLQPALTCCGLIPHPPRAHHQPLACLCCAWTPCRSFACQLSTDFSQGRQLARPCKWYLTLTVGLLGQYIAVPPTAVELDVAGITQMQLDPGVRVCMHWGAESCYVMPSRAAWLHANQVGSAGVVFPPCLATAVVHIMHCSHHPAGT